MVTLKSPSTFRTKVAVAAVNREKTLAELAKLLTLILTWTCLVKLDSFLDIKVKLGDKS